MDLADGGNALPDKDVNGCIESGDYHFEIKAGVFTGEECTNESDAHKIYTITDGKITVDNKGIATTVSRTHTATPAPGGEGGNTQNH